MAVKNNSVVEIALKYYIDGKSLIEAQAQAQRDFEAASKSGKVRNRQQQQADQKRILSESKKLNNQLARAEVASAKKVAKERASIDSKASSDRKKTLSGAFDNFGGKLGTITSYGAAIKIIQGVQDAFRFAVRTVMEFEVAFTDLAVKSGYTNKEMSAVADTVLKVASSTKFSTMEIIGAATALGKLGFEAVAVQEILPNLANVAAATGESLQATAEILGKVINAYEYTAAQSGIISDRMVDIFNNSALNLEKFNTAFSYVGSAAASTGTSFDELTASMAILSDRGITASKIGTGLRNVFTKLGREGDSLRDILQRVNEEHLSFYEVAELVGRRAANQLFIMANSLDEFDANVARSMEDYGAALKAAAQQQSTFQAKWDILMNSFSNILAPQFDPNKDFRTAMDEAIGKMDVLNSFFSSANSEAVMSRMIALFPQVAADFQKMKDSMADGSSDRSIFREMVKELEESKKSAKGNVEELKLINKEIKALEGIAGSLKLVGGKTNNFTDALLKVNEATVKNKAEKLAIDFKKELDNAIEKTRSYRGTDNSNDFIDTVFGTKEQFKAGLQQLSDWGIITSKKYAFLMKNFKSQQVNLLRNEFMTNGQGINKGGEEKLVDELKKQYIKKTQELKDVNKGSTEWTKDTLADNAGTITKGMAAIKSVADELCEKYPFAAASLGIECESKDKGRKVKKTEKFEQFDDRKKLELDSKYDIDKSRLEIQYRNEDDPIAKAGINDELLLVEITYRDTLNQMYDDYLKKMEDSKAGYIKRNPEGADAFNNNMTSIGNDKIKSATEGTKNEDKFNLRDVEATQKAYEELFNSKQAYILKNETLSNELKGNDRNDSKERKRIQDEMNSNTKDYYKLELANVNKFFDDLEQEIKDLEAENVLAVLNGQNPIDISAKTELFKKKQGTIDKVLTEEQKSLKPGSGKDNADFDYASAAVGAFTEITGLLQQAGQARLEVMQQQADAELAIIQGRYEAEMNILDSALNAGIISQDDAAAAKDRADKRKMEKENKVAKKMFDAQKKIDMETAIFTGISSTAQAIAQAFANSPNPAAAAIFAAISSAAIAASTAMNIKGISQRKFIPKKFADGGMVEGASHSRGGVPFTVRGNGGYEMEGGEFIVNKEAAKNNLAELERINGKTRTGKRKFATGGVVTEFGQNSYNNMNEALLEALSKPVRAFVTTQDLEKSESERNALAKKTSY